MRIGARVFHAIQQNQHARTPDDGVQIGVLSGGAQSYDALMGLNAGDAVERATIFKTERHVGGAGKVDDLLHTRAAGA